jgi:hypothetical protein
MNSSRVVFAGPALVCPALGHESRLELVASTFSVGELRVCVGGRISVIDSTLGVVDWLDFANTAEDDWVWEGSSALEINGGVSQPNDNATNYARIEIGSADFGTDPIGHAGAPVGYIANFALPALIIGPDAHVSLVDRQNNGNRVDHGFGRDEALYVTRVVFTDAEGRLNLNGLHLYFDELIGSQGQIVDLTRQAGDDDADGDLDLKDFSGFQLCFGNTAPDHRCRIFDFDEDDRIGLLDHAVFLATMSGPTQR